MSASAVYVFIYIYYSLLVSSGQRLNSFKMSASAVYVFIYILFSACFFRTKTKQFQDVCLCSLFSQTIYSLLVSSGQRLNSFKMSASAVYVFIYILFSAYFFRTKTKQFQDVCLCSLCFHTYIILFLFLQDKD